MKTICWRAKWYPFGEIYDEIVSTDNDMRFPGQFSDDETGLYYNWHRYYSPQLGQYYQADPIGLSDGINMYTYVAGNPMSFVDPQGLSILNDILVVSEYMSYFSNPTAFAVNKIQARLVPLLPASVREGRFLWTTGGEEAVKFWRKKYDDKCNNLFEKALYGGGGLAAALWTPETWFGTATTLASAKFMAHTEFAPRSYWQYYPKGNPGYHTNWLAGSRNLRPPYNLGSEARGALNLPPYNPATAVRRVNIKWYEPVRGPRIPKPNLNYGWESYGKGIESGRGWSWPK